MTTFKEKMIELLSNEEDGGRRINIFGVITVLSIVLTSIPLIGSATKFVFNSIQPLMQFIRSLSEMFINLRGGHDVLLDLERKGLMTNLTLQKFAIFFHMNIFEVIAYLLVSTALLLVFADYSTPAALRIFCAFSAIGTFFSTPALIVIYVSDGLNFGDIFGFLFLSFATALATCLLFLAFSEGMLKLGLYAQPPSEKASEGQQEADENYVSDDATVAVVPADTSKKDKNWGPE